MGVAEDFQNNLERYREQHPGDVTPEMFGLWQRWIEEAELYAEKQDKAGYFSNEKTAAERWRLSQKYLHGHGIEIGALHSPQRVDESVQVQYVDRFTPAELHHVYFEARQYDFVEVDVIDDGETLAKFADESLDFVISSHFLEHCQDPIGALCAHLRTLKRGGILYCAVPDCRSTLDSDRAVTSFEHLWKDHTDGPDGSRQDHLRDWAAKVNKRTGFEFEAWWRLLDATDFSIHYHVWTPWEVLELFTEVRKRLHLSFDIREFVTLPGECVFIVEKT